MCRDNMLKLKFLTTFVRFDSWGVITRVLVNLFVCVERTITIKSMVLIRLQVDAFEGSLRLGERNTIRLLKPFLVDGRGY